MGDVSLCKENVINVTSSNHVVLKLRGHFFKEKANFQLTPPANFFKPFLVWCAQVAQSVEQGTENPRVGGSIPPLGTTFRNISDCGGVVQLVRTPACHAGGREFESRHSRHKPEKEKKLMRPHRLAWSRTPAFHAGDRGSNPLGDANFLSFFWFFFVVNSVLPIPLYI